MKPMKPAPKPAADIWGSIGGMKPVTGKFDPKYDVQARKGAAADKSKRAMTPKPVPPGRRPVVAPPKTMGRHGAEDAIKFMGPGDKPKGKKK
jgi:hypothetical protein